MNEILLFLGLAFCLKHYLGDALFQTRKMFINKGDLLSVQGYLHAGVHAALTSIVLILGVKIYALPLTVYMVVLVCICEFFAHYIIDFVKINIGKNWSEYNIQKAEVLVKNDKFWAALVIDQALHFATYIFILAWVMEQ